LLYLPASMAHLPLVDRLECAALALLNPVAYALRNRLRFRRAGYSERRTTPLDALSNTLLTRHGLLPIVDRCYEGSLLSITHALDLLELFFRIEPPPIASSLRLLDVGSKNFEMAPGILASLRPFVAQPSHLESTGIELDAYRVYAHGHSRADAAAYFLGFARELGFSAAHRFLAGDVCEHDETYDCITWFSPFLTPAPLLRWGLARRHLRPEATLKHVAARLRPGGLLVIVNQEPEEAELQRAMFDRLGIRARSQTLVSAFPRKHRECHVHCVRG